MLIRLSVSHADTSSESSGYGSLHGKFGSTSSTPSVMPASHYNNEKGSKSESSEDKSRSRSVSSASLLICVAVLFYRFDVSPRQKKHIPPSLSSTSSSSHPYTLLCCFYWFVLLFCFIVFTW